MNGKGFVNHGSGLGEVGIGGWEFTGVGAVRG